MKRNKYSVPKEEFFIVGDELVSNPDRPTYLDVIEVPMGKFADLRVRVALVRSEEFGHYEDFVISDSEDVYKLMQTIDTEAQETLHIVMLDTRNAVVGVHEVSRGGLNNAAVDIKILFQAPILADAGSIILVHNHPSGKPEPSQQDLKLTTMVNEACGLLGFRLLDHVIIGAGTWASLADMGLM